MAEGLGKRYGRVWGLRDCSLTIPVGRVVGLVGANGAGKTTLLNLAVGLLAPTTGSLRVLGEVPSGTTEQLARIGFVGQAAPLYDTMTVADQARDGGELAGLEEDGQGRTGEPDRVDLPHLEGSRRRG
jgi:ABC-2 type transport system ATP-binding protein